MRSTPSATLASLAKYLEIHTSSVSRALDPAKRHLISPEVVERVEAAAHKLGYRPNRAASALRTGKSHCVGVLLPDITNPVFPPILQGIEDGLREAGFFTLVANAGGSADANAQLVRNMLAHGVDGVVLATAAQGDLLLRMLRAAAVPVVLVNRVDSGADCAAVVSDDELGMALPVAHLQSLGHRRIAHLAGPATLSTGQRRLRAFHAALTQHGLRASLVEFCDAYSVQAGFVACQRMLAQDGFADTTAIVACNDLVALGAMDALRQAGLRIPEDISLTGHNDIPFMDRVQPALTTVRIQHHEMGLSAALLLLRAMATPATAAQISNQTLVLRPDLVVRASTGQAHLKP